MATENIKPALQKAITVIDKNNRKINQHIGEIANIELEKPKVIALQATYTDAQIDAQQDSQDAQIQQILDIVSQVDNVFNIDTDVMPITKVTDTTGRFDLTTPTGSKGKFDFTDGKEIVVGIGYGIATGGIDDEKVTIGSTLAKSFHINGVNSNVESTFNVKIDTNGLLTIDGFDGLAHTDPVDVDDLHIFTVAQSQPVSVIPVGTLTRVQADALYGTVGQGTAQDAKIQINVVDISNNIDSINDNEQRITDIEDEVVDTTELDNSETIQGS